jgi:HEAT repeat protein
VPLVTADEIDRDLDALGSARKAVQRPAAERLAEAAHGDAAVRPRLVAALASPDARRRWGAAYALARVEPAPAEAMPVLLDALASSDGDIRWASARILTAAVRHEPRHATALAALARAPSALQRKMTLYCLRDLAGAVALDARALIAPALADADAAVRLAAMAAAVVLLSRTPETADLVAALLDDADAGVRRAAAATLGQLGVRTPAVEQGLARAHASGDAALERAAAQALSRLAAGGPAAAR